MAFSKVNTQYFLVYICVNFVYFLFIINSLYLPISVYYCVMCIWLLIFMIRSDSFDLILNFRAHEKAYECIRVMIFDVIIVNIYFLSLSHERKIVIRKSMLSLLLLKI